MNELKFNSSVCTTREQSQRLLDLGLKPETADMAHQYIESEWDWIISPCDWNHCTMSEELIPAWSLHRLIELYSDVEDTSSLYIKDVSYKLLIFCIGMAIHCGFFNKEYLLKK